MSHLRIRGHFLLSTGRLGVCVTLYWCAPYWRSHCERIWGNIVPFQNFQNNSSKDGLKSTDGLNKAISKAPNIRTLHTRVVWKCTSELNISHHLLIHCLNLEGRQQRIYFSEEVLACSCSLCCSRASCRLNRSSLSNHFENTVGLKLQYAKCSPQWCTNIKYQRNNAHFSHIESLLWIESN